MGANILIVDDSGTMRGLIKRTLSISGLDIGAVFEAGNGIEAVKQYQEQKPDGVLMDITMPDMDGIATLKRLMEIDSGARIAMVTAMGQQSLVIEALKSGAKDFVVKPFNADRVLAAVKKITN